MRYALGVEYDGSSYCGWQRQSHAPSVQESLELALSSIADTAVNVNCAGRTDTGVHACGQVVHFDSEASRTLDSWMLGTNSRLPPDIKISWITQATDDFHARFSATSRRYRYVILNRKVSSALLSKRVTWVYHSLDEKRMHIAAQSLLGEHDFSSFRGAGCQSRTAMRNLEFIEVSRSGDFIYIDVRANAFLQHMVRNIVGVLIDIGKGAASVEWTKQLLQVKDRTQGGVTAKPYGLYLMSVTYPQDYELPTSPDFAFFGDGRL